MSLRVKLIWPYLVVIAVTFAINRGYLSFTSLQSAPPDLTAEIHSISHSIKDALSSNDKLKVQTLVDELLLLETVSAVQLYTQESNPIILFEKSDGAVPFIKPDKIFTPNNDEHNNYFYLVEPIVYDSNKEANLGITLVRKPIVHNTQTLMEDIALLAALLIISSIFLHAYTGHIILKPLLKLNGTIQELLHEHTNYNQIRHHAKDEFGELIYSFDRMMIKLLQREKQRHHSFEVLKQKSSVSEDLIESIQYSLIITDHLGTIIQCNSATYKMFDRNRDKVLQSNICDLIKTKASTELKQILDKGIERSEFKLRSVDNKHQYSLTSRFLSKQGHLLFEVRDITELEEVMSRERIAGRVFENSQDGLIVINENGLITVVNPAVTKLLGVEAEQLIGQSIVSAIRSHKLRKMLPGIIKSIDNFGIWQGEIIEKSLSGQLIPLFAKVNRILKCENHKLYDSVIVLTDLSDAKEMERLEYLTHHDSLTGLANRSKFNLALEELVKRSAYVRDEFAILYLDLDGFKAVNDTYGHDAGDAVLKIVSERMASVTRHTDLIARLAGDEFVMLINPANQVIVTRVSEQLLESISAPISYKGDTLNVGVSIGVKLVGLNERDAERVLKSADTAMYQAKKSGKGRAILMGYEL
ncbi:diguanylate cyclase [Vibrio alginolyticus]|nr:diguanylate cyclase [Vibrio alginolyticus]